MKKKILLICVCLSVLASIFSCAVFKKLHKAILFDDYVSIRGFVDQKRLETNAPEKVHAAIDYINSMYKREVSWNYSSKSPETVIWLTNVDGKEEEISIYGDCMIYGHKLYRVFYNKVNRDLANILVE